jgi:hypothetical protein
MNGPEILIPIAFFVSVVTIVRTLVRARERRLELDAQRYSGDPDLYLRLDRMEQAIEAMAVEVERVSEAQRFTTRLLSERSGGQLSEAQHRLS